MFINNNNSSKNEKNLSILYEKLGKEVFAQMQNKPLEMDNEVFFENLMESVMNICVEISSELMAPVTNAKTDEEQETVNSFDFESGIEMESFPNGEHNSEQAYKEFSFNTESTAENEFTNIPLNDMPMKNLFDNPSANDMFTNIPINNISMVCPMCGAKVENGDVFCTKCGTKIG